MSYYSTYRWCGVPECKNTSVKTPDKLWFRVPSDINRRNTWFNVAGRDPELLYKKTRLYFCEDHFDLEHDMENYIKYKIMGSVKRIQLKPDCIPSRFEFNRKQSASNESHIDEANRFRISIAKESVQDLREEDSVKGMSSSINAKMPKILGTIGDSKDQDSLRRESVEVKLEPEDNEVLVHGQDKDNLTVKKEEQMKTETEWEHDAHSVSETADALAALYPEHEVKEELVVGPERVQPRDVVFTLRAAQITEMTEQPVESHTPCSTKQESWPGAADSERATAVARRGRRGARAQTHELRSEDRYPCQICNEKFNHLCHLKTHERIHSGNKPHTCGICNKKFAYPCHLKIHKGCHTGEKPFSCGFCKKEFTHSGHLNVHKRSHTGDKPYYCRICKQEFVQSSDLRRHERTHSGEKPYSCGICNKKFTDFGNLKKHERTHTGEKPYCCEICNKKFNRLSNLKTHERTHNGSKPFTCGICNKKFTLSGNLKKHERTHGQHVYRCDMCQKGCIQKPTRTYTDSQEERAVLKCR